MTTYRIFCSAALLLVYLFSPFKIYTPYLSYKVNYNYIAGVLCENKEKPKMQCNGKCHLNKQLKKAAKEAKDTNKTLTRLFEQEELPLNSSFVSLNNAATAKPKHLFFHLEKYASVILEHIVPPPQA